MSTEEQQRENIVRLYLPCINVCIVTENIGMLEGEILLPCLSFQNAPKYGTDIVLLIKIRSGPVIGVQNDVILS